MNRLSPEEFFSGPMLKAAGAIRSDDLGSMSDLVKGLNVNAPATRGMTLLFFAMQEQNFPAVRLLVMAGARPDEHIIPGVGSALDFAIYSKDLRFLTAFLEGGFPVNYQNRSGRSVLQRAAGPGGSIEHIKLLLEHGADPALRDSIGGTALSAAISTLKPEIALLLVQRGAPITAVQANGVSVAWSLHSVLGRQETGSEMRTRLERVREELISRRVTWPPESPEVERERARARGHMPAVPPGHTL